MHAVRILQKSLSSAFELMHAARVQTLLGAVDALLRGRRLVLMDLARSWRGATRVRAPLKRLDRLLSNRHLASERPSLYAAMSGWLLTDPHPVIAVDWSPLDARGRFQVLRAGIALEGRTLTLLEEVHPTEMLGKGWVERAFLQSLHRLVPAGCTPIIVTDAGFCHSWFGAVRAHNWDYIGRVRGKVNVRLAKEKAWRDLEPLFAGARRKAESLGSVELAKSARWPCRLIRCKQPHKGRTLLTKRGTPSRAGRSIKAQRRASEPCLLATSLAHSPAQIVRCYRQRMQIEESFRDLKCERYGSGFDLSLTRDPSRIATLLLLHALASFVAYLVARSLPERTLNVTVGGIVSKRRHYSRLWLGWQSYVATAYRSRRSSRCCRYSDLSVPSPLRDLWGNLRVRPR
jgi:hypothetical protein